MSKKKNRPVQPPKTIDLEKQKAVNIDLLDRARVFMFCIIQFADAEDIGEAEDTFMREASILWALGMLGETIVRIKQNDAGIVERYPDFPWYTLGMLTYKTDFEEEFEDNYYWLIYVYRARILNIVDLENGVDVENVIYPPWIKNMDYFFYNSKINPDEVDSYIPSENEGNSVVKENLEKKTSEQPKSSFYSERIAWVNKMLSQRSDVKPDKNIKPLSEWGKSVWTVKKR